MKKQFTILATAILMVATITNAKVWRVNNRPNVDADFTTLQAAIDGASSSDTLYIGNSPTGYGNGVFDKQLVVIGSGYWLAENDTTQAYTEHSQVGRLTFNTGSEGSVIEGLYVYYAHYQGFNVISINTDSIIVKKNYIYSYMYDGANHTGNGIRIAGNMENVKISQNWINARVHSDDSGEQIIGIYFDGIPTNCIVSNNIIRAFRSYSNGGQNAIYMATNDLTNDLIINNNVIWGSITTYHTFLVNNILVSGTYNNDVNDQTSNNLCDGTQFPDINNNLQNVDMSTVFVDYTKYIDNGYILANGSPAIGAGIEGSDCGPFYQYNGPPYILSGMPEIPAIFEVDMSATVSTTSLPVNIKASSHNANK
jgi:hypothetical protein